MCLPIPPPRKTAHRKIISVGLAKVISTSRALTRFHSHRVIGVRVEVVAHVVVWVECSSADNASSSLLQPDDMLRRGNPLACEIISHTSSAATIMHAPSTIDDANRLAPNA